MYWDVKCCRVVEVFGLSVVLCVSYEKLLVLCDVRGSCASSQLHLVLGDVHRPTFSSSFY